MKVKDVIEKLQKYNLDDEVVVLYWTKDIFDDDDNPLTDDVWFEAVKEVNDCRLDFASQVISEEILDVLRERENA